MKKHLGKILAGIIIFLGMTLLSALMHYLGTFEELNKKLSHALYEEREISDEIIIVGIDEKTLQAPQDGGLGKMSAWPREYMASAITKLRAGGAHSMFLDITYREPTDFITLTDVAKTVLDSDTLSEVGSNLASYLEGTHPQDVIFQEALGPDVFMLKLSSSNPELKDGILHVEGGNGSYKDFTALAETAFSNSAPEGNEHAIYQLPVGFQVNGEFEELMGLKIARDYLYRNQNTEGEFNADRSIYAFDDTRQIPVERGQMLVNYAAPSYSFPLISFTELVRGELPADLVEDKIILIGGTASILQDRHFTPIDSNVPMPGIEIQANVIQSILESDFLKQQGLVGFIAGSGIYTLIGTVIFLFLPFYLAALGFVLLLASFPFFAQWQFNSGVIVDLIWPMVALLFAYFAVMAYRNATEFKERRKLKQAFGHYVSPEVVNEISKNPDSLKLGGERREITVLFVDIENFTSLSEGLEPQKVVALMNQYFDGLTSVIMSHGGTVDKFEGDAIMVLFGAPLATQDHGLKACLTALALREKINELNAKSGFNLNIRVGMATGEAVVGNMGSAQRFDYTAMGDTVNTASRLESGNKFYKTRIMTNEGTMNAAQGKIIFRRIDRVRLKGKSEAVDIYEVMGLHEGLSDQGQAMLDTWHQALEYYRNQDWDNAEARIKNILKTMPEDGPAQSYLKRIADLRANPPQGWDGTWTFESK